MKDTVTAIEDVARAIENKGGGGGGGGTFVVEVKLNESNMYYLDITAGELNNAFESGKVVYSHFDDESGDSYCIMICKDEDKTGSAPGKYIYAFYSNSKILFFATDENSYPVMYQ